MEKLLIGVVIGVFIGAFTVEVLNRKRPGTIKQIEGKAAKVAESIAAAFQDGYEDGSAPNGAEAEPA